MEKSEYIRARIEPQVKYDAEAILSAVGLSATEAIRIFYNQVILERGLPFQPRIPNPETVKAIKDAKAGIGLTDTTLAAMKAKYGKNKKKSKK